MSHALKRILHPFAAASSSSSSASAPSASAVPLESVAGADLAARFLETPFQAVDRAGTGYVTFTAFEEAFAGAADPERLRATFALLDGGLGRATYGAWQQCQWRHSGTQAASLEAARMTPSNNLHLASLLEAVKASCSRNALIRQTQGSGQPFPPSSECFMEAMGREWVGPILQPLWQYANDPVPHDPAARRFPDWDGGVSVRDEGHEGMGLRDFASAHPAVTAGLTEAEVLALRLCTGPGSRFMAASLQAPTARFAATQYCADCAVGKLARSAGLRTLLIGLPDKMDAAIRRHYEHYRGIAHKREVVCSPGSLLTTTDVATIARPESGPTVLLILARDAVETKDLDAPGYLGNGADIQWVSQYPQRANVLLPSTAIFIPRLRCKHLKAQPLSLPSDKDPYQLYVYYPWDFENNSAYVASDYLVCANQLLCFLHACDEAFARECKEGRCRNPA
jgi:hypothetical protein